MDDVRFKHITGRDLKLIITFYSSRKNLDMENVFLSPISDNYAGIYFERPKIKSPHESISFK